MSVIRAKYDEEFKKNAVKLSYASPKSVKQVASDLGIAESMLYRWRKEGHSVKFCVNSCSIQTRIQGNKLWVYK
ncbi:MAG: transposase [Clostridiales bacterium]|jgi:transposase-like protein|nr:transposase [Clostridiales bacterium]